MKRICSIAIILSLAFLLAAPALAAPASEMTAVLSDAQEDENGWLFTLTIDVEAPSEPYASLDFSLICSDHTQLSIVDNSAAGDRSALDINFTKAYGNAYHKGRIDSTTGAISYLIGIFSKTSGNNITDRTQVCTVTLRYTGSGPQTLSLENLKLVYKDANGAITSAGGAKDIFFSIDPDSLADAAYGTETYEEDVPLANLPGAGPDMMLILLISLAVLLAAVVAVLLLRNHKYKLRLSSHGAGAAEPDESNSLPPL